MDQNESLEKLIANLKLAKELMLDDNIDGYYMVLSSISKLNNPDCIEPLVMQLEDNEKMDKMMFNIVHIIERFDDAVYISHLLNVLPELWLKAPRWAMILHMRVLNSPNSFDAYAARLVQSTDVESLAVRRVLHGVTAWRPEFKGRVDDFLRCSKV